MTQVSNQSVGQPVGQKDDLRQSMRQKCKESLYFLCKAVLGFVDFQPEPHLAMCQHIQSTGDLRKLILIPRGHYKSSAGSIGYPIWLLVNNPDERILLGSSTATLSQHFLRRIKAVFEKNEMFQWLFPELVPDWKNVVKWSESEMQIPRPGIFPEASIETIGVGGKVTGRHYNVMIFDDLIEEQAANSLDEMAKVQSWHDLSEPLFDAPEQGRELVIGTRWHVADLYGWLLDNDPRYKPYLRQALEDGKPIFPLRFSFEWLEQLRKTKPDMFSCQYQNDPLREGMTEFQASWLKEWTLSESGQVLIKDDLSSIRLVDLNRYIHVDPAISDRPGACRSAITVTGMDASGRPYLLDLWVKRGAGISETVDQILRLNRRWKPIATTVESVAYQKALCQILRERALSTGQYVRVIEYKPGSLKEGRIRKLQDYFIKGLFIPKVHTYVGEFRTEYVQFPVGSSVDILDSLSQGPDVWRRPVVGLEEAEELEFEERTMNVGGRSLVTGY